MDHRYREIIERVTKLAEEYGATLGGYEPNKKARLMLTIKHGDEHRKLFWPIERGNFRTDRNLETQARHILEAWLGPPKETPKPERITPDPHTKDHQRAGHPTPPRPISTQPLDLFTSPFEIKHEECFTAVMDGKGREVCHTRERPEAVWIVERLNSAKVPMHRKERAVGVSTLQSLAGEYRRRESLHLQAADAALDVQDIPAADIATKLADAFGFAAGTLESLVTAELNRNAKNKNDEEDRQRNDSTNHGFAALSRLR